LMRTMFWTVALFVIGGLGYCIGVGVLQR
jgi:hypothetical protein